MKAVITAGGPIEGAYATIAGTRIKALAPLRGVTMLDRTIAALRQVGIDRIAVGALTHSAPALDISMDMVRTWR